MWDISVGGFYKIWRCFWFFYWDDAQKFPKKIESLNLIQKLKIILLNYSQKPTNFAKRDSMRRLKNSLENHVLFIIFAWSSSQNLPNKLKQKFITRANKLQQKNIFSSAKNSSFSQFSYNVWDMCERIKIMSAFIHINKIKKKDVHNLFASIIFIYLSIKFKLKWTLFETRKLKNKLNLGNSHWKTWKTRQKVDFLLWSKVL